MTNRRAPFPQRQSAEKGLAYDSVCCHSSICFRIKKGNRDFTGKPERGENMESTLRRLFDYQDFERNEALQSVIEASHARQRRSGFHLLSDSEADYVAAAGMPGTASQSKDPWKDPD